VRTDNAKHCLSIKPSGKDTENMLNSDSWSSHNVSPSKFPVNTELFSVDLQVDLSKYYFAEKETAWDEAALSQHNDRFLCKCSNHISSSKTFITKLHAEEKKFLKNSKHICYDECKW
jgi:hypothetical protein